MIKYNCPLCLKHLRPVRLLPGGVAYQCDTCGGTAIRQRHGAPKITGANTSAMRRTDGKKKTSSNRLTNLHTRGILPV